MDVLVIILVVLVVAVLAAWLTLRRGRGEQTGGSPGLGHSSPNTSSSAPGFPGQGRGQPPAPDDPEAPGDGGGDGG